MRSGRSDRAGAGSKVTRLLVCSLAALAAAMGAGPIARSQTPPHVRVESGELQGAAADGVESFKGIPFAAPPVGDLRWRPPQPAAPWTGARQATEFGADCMQGRFGPPPAAGAPPARVPSEDCLFLNVWRPASATPGARLPVMVWIHGGGFMGGSGASPNTSGAQFAKQGVPAFNVHAGILFIGKAADFGKRKSEEFTANDYHKVTDEIKPDWDLSGAVEAASRWVAADPERRYAFTTRRAWNTGGKEE